MIERLETLTSGELPAANELRSLTEDVRALYEEVAWHLDDDQIETMLMEAFAHGEQDFKQRKLIEQRVEAKRMLMATKQALETDGDLLADDERAKIEKTASNLERSCAGIVVAAIENGIAELDRLTHDWAGRRMDRAIARAIGGKRLGAVEQTVSAAAGVDAHLQTERR